MISHVIYRYKEIKPFRTLILTFASFAIPSIGSTEDAHLPCVENGARLEPGNHVQPAIESPSLKKVFMDHFRIGAALNEDQTSGKDGSKSALIKRHFNTITSENVLKWEKVHPEPDRFHFGPSDQYVDFGTTNRMFVIGHTLIWHHQTPDWVFRDSQGMPLNRENLLDRMREHIQTVVGRYKGRIGGWDVVNEALNQDGTLRKSPWLNMIGPDYIAKAFEFAHAADPDAELYYNDYSLEIPSKRDGALALIQQLQAAGLKISGIGTQTHVGLEAPSAQMIAESLSKFAKAGVKVMITELDVSVLPAAAPDLGADVGRRLSFDAALNPYADSLPPEIQQKLANRFAELFAMFVDQSDHIDRVTFWGVTDGDSWLNNWPIRGRIDYPLLFDRDCQPKPPFEQVIRQGMRNKKPGSF